MRTPIGPNRSEFGGKALDHALDAAKQALIDAPSRACALVESHPKFDGRVRIYGLDPKPMAELKHWLEETEALWSAQLGGFQASCRARIVTPQVLVSLRLKASPARAFEIFTRGIALWWMPNALSRFTPRSLARLPSSPMKVNASPEHWRTALSSGSAASEWERGERLVFGWRQATFRPSQETVVEVTFGTVGAETRVTVVHRGWDSVPDEQVARHGLPDAIFLHHHGEWWQALLARLREHGP